MILFITSIYTFILDFLPEVDLEEGQSGPRPLHSTHLIDIVGNVWLCGMHLLQNKLLLSQIPESALIVTVALETT